MRFYFYFIILLLLIVNSSCRQKLTAKEGEKHLRAFDNELISYTKQLKSSESVAAFEKLFSIQNLPIPFRYHKQVKGEPFPFSKLKGIYRYDSLTNECIKHSDSDSIIIIFPFKSSHDSVAKFSIANYAEEISIWGPMFPTKVDVKLEVAGLTIASIKSDGILKYQVPTKSLTVFRFDRYSFHLDLHSKLSRKKSKMFVKVELKKAEETVLTCNSAMEVSQTNISGAKFNTVNLECYAFPLVIRAKANYGAIAPNTHDFISAFNRNVSIEVETENEAYIGSIRLKEKPNANRLNFVVAYNDGTYTNLEDFLFFARWILNVKC